MAHNNVSVTVRLDKQGVAARIRAANKKAIPIVANELLKDANYYCRMDTGETQRSAIRASNLKEGILVWNTPYAKRVYYTGTPSTDKNPHASLLWAERAAKENRRKYNEMYQKILSGEV